MDMPIILCERIYLKMLSFEDSLSEYLKWVNDIEIMRFTESRGANYTAEKLKEYVISMTNDHNILFGIFLKDSNKHIGNIKLGNINPIHKNADIGIIIGEKKLWGKGYASEAIENLSEYAFKELNLKKVKAGMYANNTGSLKAFKKAGFKECGRMKDDAFFEGDFVDGILVEMVNEGYTNE